MGGGGGGGGRKSILVMLLQQKLITSLHLSQITRLCQARALVKDVSSLSMCCFVSSVMFSLQGGGDSVQELLRG